MSEWIGKYRITKDFTIQGAGMSRWGLAESGGKQYFIKEFIDPKYPTNDAFPPKQLQHMRAECEAFFQQRTAFYDALAKCRTGNNVITQDFFRFRTKYYITTELVPAAGLTAQQIAALGSDVKESLLKSILYSVRALHENGLVHSDLKLDNILLKKTVGSFYSAKIIDFDSGFLLANPPCSGDEVVGDSIYFSPEAIRLMFKEEVRLTEKLDIFALGIVFHQCWCGAVPGYSEEYDCVGQAVLNGAIIRLDDCIPPTLRNLIRRMLNREPENRPSAAEAFDILCGKDRKGDETAQTPTSYDTSVWHPPKL